MCSWRHSTVPISTGAGEDRSTISKAAVSETLPMSVLFGTDIPELTSLLKGEEPEEDSEDGQMPPQA